MLIILKLLVFFFGACIGSFLNAVIWRLPRGKSLSRERSHCPSCDKLIYWFENIPIISFVFLRGRCSGCKAKISWQYPLVEFIVGIVAVLIFPQRLEPLYLVSFFLYLSIFATFVAMFIIDLKHRLLPDVLNIYLAVICLVIVVLNKPWQHFVFGGLIGLLFPLTITYLFFLLKGQVGLGGGDIKLYAALGIFLGPIGIIHNIFMSCFLGALVGSVLILSKIIDRKTPIPFGPFIIAVAIFQIFFRRYYLTFVEKIFV